MFNLFKSIDPMTVTRFSNADFFDIVRSLGSKGNLITVPDEIWRQRRADTEMRYIMAQELKEARA
jgi:hypothetical protein